MTTAAHGTTRAAALRALVAGAVENLLATWSPDHSRFPYRSRVVAGGLENEYAHPLAVRYTLNSLLGLAQAARSGDGPPLDDVRDRYAAFRARPENCTTSLADAGIHLLVALALETDDGEALVAEVGREAGAGGGVVQDVAWALWAACAAERSGVAGAGAPTVRLRARLLEELTSPLGLPYHSTRRYRRRIVSFGALVYFLRALHEAATLGDDTAERLFVDGVHHTLALQLPHGGWPWLIDSRTGAALDPYPLFAVHQDSMAMLFLLPARERGLEGVDAAIDRSLAWSFGANELGTRMYADDPVFVAYRSIERPERLARARRYARALGAVSTGRPGTTAPPPGLRLNDECRSYHPGWILFAWCGHPLVTAAIGGRDKAP